MKKNNSKFKSPQKRVESEIEKGLPGYPHYPDSEDIYENAKEERNLNPEDISKTKSSSSNNALGRKELDNEGELNGEDLDIPGSELDDADEAIGNEDEENNYYSLGGDNHNDLEEDRADIF